MTWHSRTMVVSAFVILLSALTATAQNHALQGTYIDPVVNLGLTVPASTLTAVGNPITVSCPNPNKVGCTVTADMWVTNGAATTTGNQFEICLFVDGARANLYCFGYAGTTPSDGTFVMGSSSQTVSGLAYGNHTVQTYLWSRNGCSVSYRHFTYNVYAP